MAIASEDHPNAVRVREAIHAAGGGDLSQIEALLSPAAMQRAPGLNPLSGHYPAREGFTVGAAIALTRTAISRRRTNSSSATITMPWPSTGFAPNGVPAA